MFLNNGETRSFREDRPLQMSHRFGRAIYSLIFVSALLLLIVGVYLIREGPWNNFLLGLSSDFLVVAVIFFLIEEFFRWKSQKDLLQDQKLHELDRQFQKTGEALQKIEQALLHSGVETSGRELRQILLQANKSSSRSLHLISPGDLRHMEFPAPHDGLLPILLNHPTEYPPIIYRQLLWNLRQLEVLQDWVSRFEINLEAEFRFFLPPGDKYIPILPCAIIDEQVVCFGWGYLGNSLEEVSISLKHPQVTRAFSEYFAGLWDRSQVIKQRGESLRPERVRQFHDNLNRIATAGDTLFPS